MSSSLHFYETSVPKIKRRYSIKSEYFNSVIKSFDQNMLNKKNNILKNSHLKYFTKKAYYLGYLFRLRVLTDEKENYFNLN